MASKAESRVVNLAGLVQGITLGTFPAASSIFTDPTEYDLSSTQYGACSSRITHRSAGSRSEARASISLADLTIGRRIAVLRRHRLINLRLCDISPISAWWRSASASGAGRSRSTHLLPSRLADMDVGAARQDWLCFPQYLSGYRCYLALTKEQEPQEVGNRVALGPLKVDVRHATRPVAAVKQ